MKFNELNPYYNKENIYITRVCGGCDIHLGGYWEDGGQLVAEVRDRKWLQATNAVLEAKPWLKIDGSIIIEASQDIKNEMTQYTVNEATGVKRLPDVIHEQVLGALPKEPNPVEIEEIGWHHKNWNVDVPDETPEPAIELPPWVPSIAECNDALVQEWSKIHQRLLALSVKPVMPEGVPLKAGWSRYSEVLGLWAECIPSLSSRAMVIDFETVKVAEDDWRPVVCVVWDGGTWYVWRADTRLDAYQLKRTISVGRKNLYVGHNVGYDQNYITEEFSHQPSGSLAWDTMGSHIVTNGVSNQQRPLLAMKGDEDTLVPEWLDYTSAASLDAVSELYLGRKLDKGVRDEIVNGGWEWVRNNMTSVITYCISDVVATTEVFQVLYPQWLNAVPDCGVRLGTMQQTSMYVPLSSHADTFYSNAEDKYQGIKGDISQRLIDTAVKVSDELGQHLEWIECELDANQPGRVYMTRGVKNPRRYELIWTAEHQPTELQQLQIQGLDWTPKSSKKYGNLPVWLVDFFNNPTYGRGVVPLILGITWLGSPVRWVESEDLHGWCFINADGNLEQLPSPDKQGKPVSQIFIKGYCTRGADDSSEEAVSALDSLVPGGREILLQAMSLQFWRSFRKRVAALRIVRSDKGVRIAKPSFTRTISNRCADPVWMVMSHPKPRRIGSWMRWLIRPPEGYVFVKADIDSQELDLFAAMGDSKWGFYGATPLGKSIRVGDKDKKTDPHSLLGVKTGIKNRTLLKNINYGSIYGLAEKGKADYVQKSNPAISRAEAVSIARTIGASLEGTKSALTGEYVGGMASDAFNHVAKVYKSRSPRTPYGQMALTRALVKAGWKKYSTTFQNWVVQASGSCMTTKLLAICYHLLRLQSVPARLVLTVHDELCFMVKTEYAEKLVVIMQMAHLLCRADITTHMGLDCLPANGSWFSSVEVDTVFRKEANAKASAPDMPDLGIAPGKAYTPSDLPMLLTNY